MNKRHYALVAGISYLIIFFTAIYANFFALELLLQNPVAAVEQSGLAVRVGIMAFLIAAIFDVFVAWALYEMYKEHPFSRVSTYFRIMHATIMGAAVFALPLVFSAGLSRGNIASSYCVQHALAHWPILLRCSLVVAK